jgi:hypothetical protein
VNQGRGPAGTPGLAPAARGAALIGLLVIVGIVGLQILDDTGPGSSVTTTAPVVTTSPAVTTAPTGTTAATATTKPAATTTTKPATTTTKSATSTAAKANATGTTTGLRKNSAVRVVVYNASDVQGAAANMRDKLRSLGYNVIGTGNLKAQKGVFVECKKGFEKEADALAFTGVQGAQVAAYPASPPSGAGNADCLVILGST